MSELHHAAPREPLLREPRQVFVLYNIRDDVNGDASGYKTSSTSAMGHQSSIMDRQIHLIVAVLACAATVSSSPPLGPFPHGKTTIYNYRTVVTTSPSSEPIYSSQYVLEGVLNVTHDTRDPSLRNAYNVVLSKVKTAMHNGKNADYNDEPILQPIEMAATVIEKPFLIMYYDRGNLGAVKIDEDEPAWSKNMKMAIASMLQVDLTDVDTVNRTNEPSTIVMLESTLQGRCDVSYIVYPNERMNLNNPELININTTFTPMGCTYSAFDTFTNVDVPRCFFRKKPRLFSDGYKHFEIEKRGDQFVIKKLVVDSSIGFFSPNGASYPHYVLTNTTITWIGEEEKSENGEALGDFAMLWPHYLVDYIILAIDDTQGRHVVELGNMPTQLEKLLFEALSHIEENHLDPESMDWDKSRTISKILDLMSYMDVETLQASFDIFEDMAHPQAEPIKNIFLGIVSQVGTPAACNFTLNLIRRNEISSMTAIDMLTKLPMNVRVPTIELLAQMEDLAKLSDPITLEVRKAGILSFATLVHRTFYRRFDTQSNIHLIRYLQTFFDRVKDEPTYEMKIVYLMAMRNIGVGPIHDFLEPIINGRLVLSKDPNHLRLLAIWAVEKSFVNDYGNAERIFFPVMTDADLPIKLRIAAYEILINIARDEDAVIAIHDYVSHLGNEHFYNYHYKTMDMIAKSKDPCKADLRTYVRSVLKTIVWPPKSHEKIRYSLSDVGSVAYHSDDYFYGEEIELGMIVNEFTGLPEVGRMKHVVIDDDGAVNDMEIQVHIEGHDGIWKVLSPPFEYGVTIPGIRKLLEEAGKSLPPMKNLHIDVVIMRKGQVVVANHYDTENLYTISNDMIGYYYPQMASNYTFNYQNVMFDRLKEKRLWSDAGIPIIVRTEIPILSSLKFDYKQLDEKSWDLALQMKRSKYGETSTSFYNPINDVWHATRSASTTEVSIALRIICTIDQDKQMLRFSFPEREDAKPVIAGLGFRGVHLVTIDDNGNGTVLEKTCPSCRRSEIIHDEDIDLGKYKTMSVDPKSVGLKFTVLTYNYGYVGKSEADWGYLAKWDKSFVSNISNGWDDRFMQDLMKMRKTWQTEEMSMLMRNGGKVLKIESSTENPISHIDSKLRVKYEDLDINETNLDYLHAEMWRINGTIDVVSGVTNATVQLWDFDVDVDMNRDHLANKASVMIIRKSPEEMDYKICMDAKNNYPISPEDVLKVGSLSEEIYSKLIVRYGYTNEERCPTNATAMTFMVKAELSDKQKNRLKHDLQNGTCSNDKKNALFGNLNKLVPRTIECMDEAIRYTTPRKYNVDVTHEGLPIGSSAWRMYGRSPGEIKPSGTRRLKFQAEFPMDENVIDIQWTNDNHIITKERVSIDLGRGHHTPDMNPIWALLSHNTRFNLKYLLDYTDGDVRMCTVYPRIVVTGDGENVPFTIPSHEWIMISGDHVEKKFAIFATQTRPNYLSFVVLIRDHGVRFYTRESDNVLVAVADDDEVPTDRGFRLPKDEHFIWNLQVTKRNDHFVVQLRQVSLTLLVGPDYISVVHDAFAQGRVSGLCGHLNGTLVNGHLDIFSIDEIPKLT